MKVMVKKWGNSAAIRIPAAVMEAMHLDLDEVVDVREGAAAVPQGPDDAGGAELPPDEELEG